MAGGDFAVVQIEVENLVNVAFAGEEFVADDEEAEGIAESFPGGEVLAGSVEDLDAFVAAIASV